MDIALRSANDIVEDQSSNDQSLAGFPMDKKTARQMLDPSLNAEDRTGQPPGAAIDEIREILLGDALRDCHTRLAEAEDLIEQLGRNLESKFADLKETPWDNLSNAISALWYRLDILERRFGELDAHVRDRLVQVSSTLDTAKAVDERLRAIEQKIGSDG